MSEPRLYSSMGEVMGKKKEGEEKGKKEKPGKRRVHLCIIRR